MPSPTTHKQQLAVAFASGALTAAGILWLLRLKRWSKAVYVQKPHPNWVAPAKQPPPFDASAMRDIDPATYSPAELYPLVISAVVPRPIGFVSSMGKDGSINLAPYRQVTCWHGVCVYVCVVVG